MMKSKKERIDSILKQLGREIPSQNGAFRSKKSGFFDTPKMYPSNASKKNWTDPDKRINLHLIILVNMKW